MVFFAKGYNKIPAREIIFAGGGVFNKKNYRIRNLFPVYGRIIVSIFVMSSEKYLFYVFLPYSYKLYASAGIKSSFSIPFFNPVSGFIQSIIFASRRNDKRLRI